MNTQPTEAEPTARARRIAELIRTNETPDSYQYIALKFAAEDVIEEPSEYRLAELAAVLEAIGLVADEKAAALAATVAEMKGEPLVDEQPAAPAPAAQLPAADEPALVAPTSYRPDGPELLRALVAELSEHGLPVPLGIEIYEKWHSFHLRTPNNDRAAVDEWAKQLGLPAPVLGSVVETTDRPWREYKAGRAQWLGWTVTLWASIDEPEAADGSAGGAS